MGLASTPASAQTNTGSGGGPSNLGTNLGLPGAAVPPALALVKADPYKAPLAPACDTIPAEILELSSLLGPDLAASVAAPEKTLTQRGVEAAKGFVPYSGVVRFVTGASKKDKEMREAVLAGSARRGFLRGMEINLKCAAATESTPAADPPKPGKKGRAKSAKSG